MDLSLISIFLSFIFSILFSFYYLGSMLKPCRTSNKSLQIPPGSTGWPFIGETLDFLSAAKKGVNETFLTERVKKYSSKIFKTSLFGQTMVVICSAEGNKFLFSNENKLVKSWWPRSVDVIFDNSDGSKHNGDESKAVRKLVHPYLKPNTLQKYVEIMDSEIKHHLRTHWNNKQEIKVYPLAKYFTFALACRLHLGIEDPEKLERHEKKIRELSDGFVSLPINFPATKFNRAVKAAKLRRKEIEAVVKQWKVHVSEIGMAKYSSEAIWLDVLKKVHDDGQFVDESDIANRALGFLFAAYDTRSAALTSITMCLAELPNVYNEVLKEQMEIAKSKSPGELLNWGDLQKMRYSWNVVCEVLRLYPPVFGAFKEAIADFTYDGFLIPKGWKNPEYFSDPNKFDPSRFEGNVQIPFSYVPFGGGSRICTGSEYARIMILVFVHNLVVKFKWEKVFPDEKIVSDPHLKPTKGLQIRLYPHQL